ncbi:magnesium ion transporter [Coemansia interrupta]|uniref:Magnesium transporter n=1 Tax=Coemansia interrupta TaxID=1126814 RepID=A0A9W8HFX0_9FUNG|nr:magnesium ion transporter [Coemansia interrupta]
MSTPCGLAGSLLRRPSVYLWQLFSLTPCCGRPIATTTAAAAAAPAALFLTKKTRPCRTPPALPPGYMRHRRLSFNMFDLLPDLERLKTKRSKRLEAAVGKGSVGKGFLSDLEHHTRPLKGFERMARPHKASSGGDAQAQARALKQEVYRFQRSADQPPDKRPDEAAGVRIEQLQQTPDLTLRCTELDMAGNVTVRAGEFPKSELCAQHGLQPRDLRKIDSKFVNQMPAILVRRHAILVNLLHIRALIEADRIVLFDSIGAPASYSQSLLVFELQERLRSGGAEPQQPFEFRALEAVLISVVSALQSDEEVLVNLVQNLLAYLEESVDRSKLRELLQYSKRLSRFEQKALNIRDAIEEVLEQDEDLAAMYLTQKLNGAVRDTDEHEEVELMMETYLKQVEEIVNHVESVSSHVRTTEDVVNIILDSQRNSLLLLEIRLTILTVGLSTGTFLSGLFGMNLVNALENRPEAFFVVSTIAFLAIFSLTFAGLRAMQKVLRKIN